MPKALIVEDEPEANQLLAMLVQLRGYATESAFTGLEALERAGKSRPDVVFLDLMLPDLSGFEVCRKLRRSRTTCGIPVVMVTARIATENRIQGFRSGATEYVAKPYTPDQIFDAMSRAQEWRSKLERAELDGSIALDSRSETEFSRDISGFRTLLLERTSLSEDAAQSLGEALLEIATLAVSWGARTGRGLVASLDYECDSEKVSVILNDRSGWFSDESSREFDGLEGALAQGRFDEVVANYRQSHVLLRRYFSPQS